MLIRQIAVLYVKTEIYYWSCLSCHLPLLRSTCLRCLHSRTRQMTHAALSRPTVKVHILVTFVVSSEQNSADKFISLETTSSFHSVRHNSFSSLSVSSVFLLTRLHLALYVWVLVRLMLFKTAFEKIGKTKWTEHFETCWFTLIEVLYITVYEQMYFFVWYMFVHLNFITFAICHL